MARQYNINNNRRKDSSEIDHYGEVLKKAREKHGIDLSEVASELRVREDILIALEDGDFSKIPPQGYSRNMIKSYARMLGLNANKITEMFLDAEYSYQISKKRASVQQISNENKKRVPKVEKSRGKYITPREQLEQRRLNKENPSRVDDESLLPVGTRTMHVYGKKYKNTPRARRELDINSELHKGRKSDNSRNSAVIGRDFIEDENYKTARERLEARMRNNMTSPRKNRKEKNPFTENEKKKRNFGALKNRHKIDRRSASKLTDEEDPNAILDDSNRSSGYQFMKVYHKQNNSGQSQMTIPIVAGAVIVLVILLILVFSFVGKQQENDKTDVSRLNVVGISDIEKPNNNSNNENEENREKAVADEPKDVSFKYKVVGSATVYMEIYENDSNHPILARELQPGETNEFKVTGTLKIVTSRPSGVELYVDNQIVQPVDEKGKGVYTYTVDFKQYLAQWKATHTAKQN